MRLTLVLTFCLSVFSMTYSQTPENPWSFDVSVNSVSVKDEDRSKLSLPTLSLSRYIFGNFSLGLNFSENNVEVSNRDLYYYSLDGIIRYDISNQTELLGVDIDPYLFAGYGVSKFGDDGNFSNTSFGGGLNFQLSKNIALNAGVSYKSVGENNAYNHLQHVVGVKFNFGKGDSDGDGVPDKKDHCPDVPGLAELNGCPDSDGDGIPDEKDQCPTAPGMDSKSGCPDSDGDGFEDRIDPCPKKPGVNNSPCPDSDGDGITDDADNCPNEKGPKSNNGCKLDDIDGDGVPNIEDLCPNEKGDPLFSGCPQIPISLENFINSTEIYFDFDSSETKSTETEKVDNLVNQLNQYKHIKISINGHASFEGESLYNKLLSDKRANSVKLMIENNGIDSMRLKVNGFGEDQQKYPNIPPSERAKNRRVQFKID